MIAIVMAAAVAATSASIIALLIYFFHNRTAKFRAATYIPSLAAILVAPPCFFVSVVVGGNFGGAYGEFLGHLVLHRESVGFIFAGITVGMWLIFTAPEAFVVAALSLLVLRRRAFT